MDSRQAKEILRLYRPAASDPDDREMLEALALARQDAELGRWLEQHLATQAALRDKFRAIPIPEGLREQILSERVVESSSRPRVSVLRVTLGVAALMLILAMVNFWPRGGEDTSFLGFRQRMARVSQNQYPHMDVETNDLKEIKRFLAAHGQTNYVLPESLEKTTVTGCALLKWQGLPVTMICFKQAAAGKSTDPDLFLFFMAEGNLGKLPEAGHPDMATIGRLNTASWVNHGKVYVLGSFSQLEELRKLL